MQVTPRVHQVDGLGMGRAYILLGDGVTVVDSSMPGHGKQILEAVVRLGKRPQDVRRVVVTHHHVDHVGSAAELIEATGAELYAHEADVPYVRGEQVQEANAPAFVRALMRRLGPKPPRGSEVHHALRDGDTIPIGGTLRVIHAPGHTMGSVALLWEEESVLFTGDALSHLFRISLPVGIFTEDMGMAKRSAAKLASLRFETACFGHGAPIVGGASDRIARAASRWAAPASA
ncbi:MAG TPA: MBL fold metallo-hydrolase [Dehalococcoidia bacterium]|nr:MBL fold metallo-hydrolase [Dehalococcoidia bacterium]